HVTLTGQIPQSELPWLYASSDLFVFPSESEVSPNVVIEAKASGLPVFISSRDGGAQFIQFSGLDGVLVDDPDPMAWAEAIAPYLAPPLDKGMESSVDDRELQTTDAILRRYSMGTAARHTIDQVPHWSDVLTMDLLPVWEHVWAEHQSTHQHHHKPKKLA
ncbi:MAG: glycosyltransferase family 4 protein, partial [Synechococcales cyanobacterium]